MPALPSSEQPLNVEYYVRKLLKSARNKFGLFRQYHATCFPDHDPNENITHEDLMDTSPDTFAGYLADCYQPYPNQTLFLLGEWYWNGGLKKTLSGFQNLIKIVGHPSFQPLGETLAQANDRGSDMGYESDNPELSLEGHDLEGWDDIEMDDVADVDGDEDIGEFEDFTGMY
jgi:hypothetical protein